MYKGGTVEFLYNYGKEPNIVKNGHLDIGWKSKRKPLSVQDFMHQQLGLLPETDTTSIWPDS